MARFCTLYKMDRKRADTAYLVGLLSRLDALLKVPPGALFRELSFDESIEKALLENQGFLGKLLMVAKVMERGESRRTLELLRRLNLSPRALSDLLAQSWDAVLAKMGGTRS